MGLRGVDVRPAIHPAIRLPVSDWCVVTEGALRSTRLLGPFSELVAAADVSDPFVLNWVNLLSFLLSGQKADATIAAEIVSPRT